MCVALASDGTLHPTGQSVADCTGYVLASPAQVFVSDTIAKAFELPGPEVLLGWWFGCFSVVMVCYLAGRYVGAVVNFVK